MLHIIGLTGGIASGKSTVSAFLEDAGAIIVDADKIARDVVLKGKPAWEEIVNTFGKKVLLPDGQINRVYLGDIIFNDPVKKSILNSIVHPRVFTETENCLAEIEEKQACEVVILDVPLLFESGMHKGLSEVIVVYVPESVQIERLIARDNLTKEQAMVRICSQMPIEEKKCLATIVIDNTGSLDNTRRISLAVYRYLSSEFFAHKPVPAEPA